MPRISRFLQASLACTILLALPGWAAAQAASIVGVVQDASGAVLPGVTVEATSPGFTERRVAVSDASGRYALIDLRPGTYTVVFTLQGFQTFRREGVILQGSFAAQVNASMRIGAIEEAITVTAASPVVDVQSTRNQLVTTREILEQLPTARQMQGAAALVPGVVSYNSSSSAPGVQDFWVNRQSVRGSPTGDSNYRTDGMATNSMMIGTGSQPKSGGINDLTSEEIVYDAGGISAEYASGGIRANAIPKEGTNRFSGTIRALGQRPSWQGDNLTAELANSISAVNKIDYNWETNFALGGPIQTDKLWFYLAFRMNKFNLLNTNQFWPDGRQADSGGHINPNGSARITYQMSEKDKLAATYQGSTSLIDRYDNDSRTSPEAGFSVGAPVNWSGALKWTSVRTNRLLLEVGQSYSVASYEYQYQTSVGPNEVSHFNLTTGRRTVATAAPVYDLNQTINTVANASYVTGSHNVKVGANLVMGTERQQNLYHAGILQLNFLNIGGVETPVAITVTNTPIDSHNDVKGSLGLFLQDTWTRNRLTLIAGGRFDYLNAALPAQTMPAGPFVPVRNSDAISCVPCWSNWTMRVSGAYDLFGNAKTAIKMAVGQYVSSELMTVAASVNPMRRATDTRSWTDLDGNGTAVDAFGDIQRAEIGPSGNANFGLPAGANSWDPNTPRSTDWEESVLIQHELLTGVSLSAGYYLHQYNDLQVIKNNAVDPNTDFTPFTIVGPADPKLPGGGGEVITQYNLVPGKLGAVDTVRTLSTNTRKYRGFEVSVNARLPRGAFAFGSVTTERTATTDCDVTNSDPNNNRFCDQTPPYQSQVKLAGGTPLPFGVQLSGSITVRPGASIAANYSYNSAIAGVALTGGGSRSVNLVDPTVLFYDSIKSVDARLARSFRFGQKRAQIFLEIYNLPNLSTVLQVNTAYGPQWLVPTVVTQARRLQLGGQFDF